MDPPPPPPPLDRAHPPAVLFTAIAREDVRPEERGQGDILELANEQSVRVTEDVDEHWYRYEDMWESTSCTLLDFSWGD